MNTDFLTGPVAQAIGWALLHLVWQGVLVAAILAATLALMTRRSANARYLVSCGALAMLLLLGVATAYHAYEPPMTPEASFTVAAVSADTEAAPMAQTTPLVADVTWGERTDAVITTAREHLPQIVLVWLVGVIVFSIRLLVSWMRAHRLVKAHAQPASPEWEAAVARLAGALELRRAVRLLQSAAVEVPTVIGWLRPVVLLPVSTLSGLSPQQLEMVLAHELAHIRRHDFFVNLLQAVVETLMFYHPAVWWMSGRVRIERENCCDDLAVAVCGNALQYARALTRLEELRVDVMPLAVAANGGSLLSRIRRIVGSPSDSANNAPRWAAGAAMLTIVALVLTAPSLPAMAQRDEAKPAETTVDVTTPANTADDDEDPYDSDDDHDVDVPDVPDVPEVPDLPELPEVPDVDVDVDFDHDVPMIAAVPPVPAVSPVPAPMPSPAPMVVPAIAPVPPVAPIVDAVMSSLDVAVTQGVNGAMLALGDLQIDMNDDDDDDDEREESRSSSSASASSNGKLSVDDLIRLRTAGVTPEYIAQMRTSSGLGELTLKQISELRLHGVTLDYIKAMRAAGIEIKTSRDAASLRMHGVTADYIKQMAAAGYANLPTRELVSLRMHGVNPQYISDMAGAGYRNLTVKELTSLKMHGVSPKFVQSLRDAGYTKLSVRDLVRLASAGVNGDFIRDMSKYRTK